MSSAEADTVPEWDGWTIECHSTGRDEHGGSTSKEFIDELAVSIITLPDTRVLSVAAETWKKTGENKESCENEICVFLNAAGRKLMREALDKFTEDFE